MKDLTPSPARALPVEWSEQMKDLTPKPSRWCLRFTTLWYQKTISDENKQMKDLTPETSK